MSISSRVQLGKLLKTQGVNEKQQLVRQQQIRSDSLYNLKDFLPNTSLVNIQTKPKLNSTITHLPTNQKRLINNNNNTLSAINVEQKMIQQKLNKLKQQNAQLQLALHQQKQLNLKQQQQIANLKGIINSMKTKQQNKHNQLAFWSYKYHFEYIPKQRHKYQLAVQTEDIFTSKCQATGSLKAKDFQDIYKRLNLNSNPSTIQLGNKSSIKQINSLKSTSTFGSYNTSGIQQNISNIKITKGNQSKKVIFKIPRMEELIQKDNKQNIMGESNINFRKNPMQMKMGKFRGEQKPIRQQCLQIYPLQEQFVDSVVGELLCGQDE